MSVISSARRPAHEAASSICSRTYARFSVNSPDAELMARILACAAGNSVLVAQASAAADLCRVCDCPFIGRLRVRLTKSHSQEWLRHSRLPCGIAALTLDWRNHYGDPREINRPRRNRRIGEAHATRPVGARTRGAGAGYVLHQFSAL